MFAYTNNMVILFSCSTIAPPKIKKGTLKFF